MAQVSSSTPDLTEAQLVALELADAMMIDPAGASAELRTRLLAHFSEAQIVELCLDIMKWSYQKVAVALGVDNEVVPGELSELSFDGDGNWIRPST